MPNQTRISIIGAGAAGLACAISCAQELERCGMRDCAAITLYESSKKPGHSILASGNGRCNFSHSPLDVSRYYQGGYCYVGACNDVAPNIGTSVVDGKDNKGFCANELKSNGINLVAQVHEALAHNGVASALSWLEKLGLVWRAVPSMHASGIVCGVDTSEKMEEDTCTDALLYPFSNKARSVLDVLLRACTQHGITIQTQTPITAADNAEITSSDVVVVALGHALHNSSLATALLPHGIIEPTHMVLGPVRVAETLPKALDGVRVKACVTLPQCGFSEQGEVLFRSYGLSGIVIFNASRFIQEGCPITLDLAPEYSLKQLEKLLFARYGQCASSIAPMPDVSFFLEGMLLSSVAAEVCKQAGVSASSEITKHACKKLAHAMKYLTYTVCGVEENQTCQVMRGGCSVNSVNPQTLELYARPNWYVVGEALDVDGPCGGYNLDWAWTSGINAGISIAHKIATVQ